MHLNVDINGNNIVKYTYDAWGNVVSTEHNDLWSMLLGSRTYGLKIGSKAADIKGIANAIFQAGKWKPGEAIEAFTQTLLSIAEVS